MPTIDELRRSLPKYHPGQEPPPYVQATIPTRPKAPRYLEPGPDSEDRAKAVLTATFGATVDKAATVYNAKPADFQGTIPLLLDGIVQERRLLFEVKGISPGHAFSLAGLHQRDRLDKAWHAGQSRPLVLVVLVWWDSYPGAKSHAESESGRTMRRWLYQDVFIDTMHVIAWRRWLAIESEMQEMAANGGAWQGKSIRPRKEEYGLLASSAVTPVYANRRVVRWEINPDHWYRLVAPGGRLPVQLDL